jgi:transcriptional regulator with XRE-family HTH domain
MIEIEGIRSNLVGCKIYTVAKATGLSYPTIQAFIQGTRSNFTIKTIQKLAEYVKNQEESDVKQSGSAAVAASEGATER